MKANTSRLEEYLRFVNDGEGPNLKPSQYSEVEEIMVGSDHGCTWWLIAPFEDGEGFAMYSLYVCDADSLYIDVIRHDDEDPATQVVKTLNIDYEQRPTS